MKKFLQALFIFITALSIGVCTFADVKPPQVKAGGSALIDYNSGQFIIEKNSHKKFAPASTTKILTALLTLEHCKLSDKVTVGKNPTLEEPSKIYLKIGEQLTVEQLLYALLLESANDAALALGEHISGSKAAFAALMNKRAKELACTDSNFTNPNGLYDKNHYTSAHDLAIISIKAMENPLFRKIVSTVSFTIGPTNKRNTPRHLHNHNKLLYVKNYKCIGGNGIKTGYTFKARHTYVGSATRADRTLIAVFLYDDKTFYNETKAYINYGFDNFMNKKIALKNDIIGSYLPKGSNNRISVYPQQDIYITLSKNDKSVITKKIDYNTNIINFKQGDVVGQISVKYGKNSIKIVGLTAGSDYTKKKGIINSGSKIFKISNLKYVLLLGFIAFLSRGFYKKYKRNKNSFMM